MQGLIIYFVMRRDAIPSPVNCSHHDHAKSIPHVEIFSKSTRLNIQTFKHSEWP